MRKFITFILVLAGMPVFGQNISFEDWQREARENKKLLPKYGNLEKSAQEKKSDDEFIQRLLNESKTRENASDHLIDLGFQYLYRGDVKTAMYRFNQAYLLDSLNSDIYWGYGAVYMFFNRFDMAREQYEVGLHIDKENDKILVDYGTTFLAEFYLESDISEGQKQLDQAIGNLQRAFEINPENSNASFKLSICNFLKNDCREARKYLKIAEDIGNPNITDAFKADLIKKCGLENLDCTHIRTGTFKHVGENEGETIIVRTNEYQIEENKKLGHKIKLKVTWIDDCVYQLKPLEDLLNPENTKLPDMTITCTITEITSTGYHISIVSDVAQTPVYMEINTLD